MGFIIGLLTVVMVFDCLLLILLVLIQLPKKEAGAALAFGGGTTDALFGAGSGTVLTKITKYAATGFFVLAVIVSVLVSKFRTQGLSSFERNLNTPGPAPRSSAPAAPGSPAPAAPGSGPAAQSVSPASQATNIILPANLEATNVSAPAAAPAAPPATSNAPVSTPK
jgi:protein translocase SecG subunit